MGEKRKRSQPHLQAQKPVIGLALGSGAARGWAHIGVIQALAEQGIEPQMVAGSSVGALVGAAYTCGNLEHLDHWARDLRWNRYLRYVDISLSGGGMVKGARLMATLRHYIRDVPIESLNKPFGAVATDLRTGREIWLQRGSLLESVRASIALPGILTPQRQGDHWLLDGGLVNPVPVSLCRALGAQVVIAVNLNGDRIGRHFRKPTRASARKDPPKAESELLSELSQTLRPPLRERAGTLLSGLRGTRRRGPGMMVVLASALNIMQDRLTRSRMAGDPPDVLLVPRLAHINLLEFDRAEESIEEGRACVERMKSALQDVFL